MAEVSTLTLVRKSCIFIVFLGMDSIIIIINNVTRASADVIRENYFHIGYVEQSYALHTTGAKNKYGEK